MENIFCLAFHQPFFLLSLILAQTSMLIIFFIILSFVLILYFLLFFGSSPFSLVRRSNVLQHINFIWLIFEFILAAQFGDQICTDQRVIQIIIFRLCLIVLWPCLWGWLVILFLIWIYQWFYLIMFGLHLDWIIEINYVIIFSSFNPL